VLFISSKFWISRINKATGKNPGPLRLKNIFFLLTILTLLQWNNFAISAPDSELAAPPAQDQSFRPALWETLNHSRQMPGESPVVTDFDGDNKWDIAKARLTGDQYEIVILLSSRSGPTALKPAVRLGGFTLLACDINKDSFQDIVVVSPAAAHPNAVWLGDGKGGFTAADLERFDNQFDIAGFPNYSSCTFPMQPDILIEFRHLVCEKPILAFIGFDLGPNGFVGSKSNIRLLQNGHFSLTLRGPPVVSPSTPGLRFYC
jgi:hypothetical protein